VIWSVLLATAIVYVYSESTQPSDTQDRLDAWSTRILTLATLAPWVLLVPFLGYCFARLGQIRLAPMLILSLVLTALGGTALILVLSHVNTCNTEIGFPFTSSC
jgi:hypothetical protein